MTPIVTDRRRPLTRRGTLATAVLGSALVVAACSSPATQTDATQSQTTGSLLDQHGLSGLDARQIIDQLDAQPVADRPTDLLASVEPDELVLTDPTDRTGETTTLPMPDDEFYLSVAPYRDQTHNCVFHSLTTCQGELSGQDIEVTVTDDQTGQVILDDTRTTFDNGFVGLWLPRDTTGTLTIRYDDAEATSPVGTGDDDLTCLTTMQLT